MSQHSASPFGKITRTLRGYESRADFAKRVGVGEGTIANIESGHRSRSPKLLSALLNAFPAEAATIRSGYESSPSSPNSIRNVSDDEIADGDLPETVTVNMETGELVTARDIILLELEDGSSDSLKTFKLLGMLAHTYLADPDMDTSKALEALDNALEFGADAVSEDELTRLRADVALRMAGLPGDQEHLIVANALLDAALLADPTNAALWRSKGLVSWDRHDFGNAYSALTISLDSNDDRSLFYRAAVLADWGNWDLAEADLTSVIDKRTQYHFSALTRRHARSWRAYVWAKQGRWSAAKAEFDSVALSLDTSSMFHYIRGIAFLDNEDRRAAIGEFTKALSPTMSSPLCPLKREAASARLAELAPSNRVYKGKKR